MRAAFQDLSVQAIFYAYPAPVRTPLLKLRELIFSAAGENGITETLKWGQPAYLPVNRRMGTTIRLDALAGLPRHYAMFVHCQTALVDRYRELYGDLLTFQGNRAIVLSVDDEPPIDVLAHCVSLALTYHQWHKP